MDIQNGYTTETEVTKKKKRQVLKTLESQFSKEEFKGGTTYKITESGLWTPYLKRRKVSRIIYQEN